MFLIYIFFVYQVFCFHLGRNSSMISQIFDTNTYCCQKPDLLFEKESNFLQAPNRVVITLDASVFRSSCSQMF